MNEEEKQAIEYIRNCLDDEYDFKNATRQKDKEVYKIILKLIEKQQKEIENYQVLKDDIEGHRIVYVDTPEFEEKCISKDKLKEIIEEQKKFLSKESSKYDEDDIEHRKAIQYASARLSFFISRYI